jgi:hypothetical protein
MSQDATKGAEILAIQFFRRGKCWKAENPEEAIRLRQQLEVEEILKVGPSDSGIDGLGGP